MHSDITYENYIRFVVGVILTSTLFVILQRSISDYVIQLMLAHHLSKHFPLRKQFQTDDLLQHDYEANYHFVYK